MSVIGQATPLLDARRRVDGSLPFVLNLRLPGMLHAKVLRSPYPHARIMRLDPSAAAQMPGVVAVLTGRELAEAPGISHLYGLRQKDQPVLAVDKVRFVGEPVVAVAAETADQAEAALAAIEVEYDPLPAVDGELEACAPGAPLVHDGVAGNMGTHYKLRHGDVEAAFARCDVVLEETYTSPAAQHVTLEPHVTLAQFEAGGLTVHSTSQAPYAVRSALAGIFGLAPERVSVKVGPLGGGYGGKGHLRLEPLVAALAWKTGGRPVRLEATRAEEFVIVTKHPATVRLKTGARRDGTLVAREVDVWWNIGAYMDASHMLTRGGLLRAVGPYRFEAVRGDSYGVYTNRPPAAAFRGAMASQGAWAYESHMDSLAHRLGLDPLALRHKNLLRLDDRWVTGEAMHDAHYAELLDEAVRLLDWQRPLVRAEGALRRGRGMAVMLKSAQTPSRSEARVAVHDDGRATVFTSAVEMGQGAHTILAQIAADSLALPADAVQVVGPDTSVTPFEPVTSGSRTTHMMGGAVQRAAQAVGQELKALGGRRFEVEPSALKLADGQVCMPDGQSASYASLLQWAGQPSLERLGEHKVEGQMDDNSQGIGSAHWHQGAGACEVEVDVETGRLRVTRYAGTSWAGRVVNPVRARAQNQGNIIYGLGPTLFEAMVFDGGQVTNANLSDYLIPSLLDIPPELLTACLESSEPDAEMHGIGEMTLPCVAPAVANALFDATGIRLYDLPLTAERIWRALREQAAQAGAGGKEA